MYSRSLTRTLGPYGASWSLVFHWSWLVPAAPCALLGHPCITHYALRHGYSGVGLRLRSWQLQGSKDGTRWTTLDQHKDDDSLPAKGWCVAHWAVKGVKEEYQHFRIKQTGKNSGGGNVLSCAGIELYGKLRQLPAPASGPEA